MNMFSHSCERRISVDPLYFGRLLVNMIRCIPIFDYCCWEWTVLQRGIVEFFYSFIFANECSFLLKRFHIRRKENPIHFDVNRYHKSIVSMDSFGYSFSIRHNKLYFSFVKSVNKKFETVWGAPSSYINRLAGFLSMSRYKVVPEF